MKKKLSVIISVICIIVSLGSISGTLYYAKNHNTFSMMQQTGGTPPAMPSQRDNSSQDSNQNNSQQNNESNQQDSSENSNQSTNDQSNSQATTQNGQAPSGMPGQSDQNSNGTQQGMPGQNEQNSNQPSQMNQNTSSNLSLSALQIVICGEIS